MGLLVYSYPAPRMREWSQAISFVRLLSSVIKKIEKTFTVFIFTQGYMFCPSVSLPLSHHLFIPQNLYTLGGYKVYLFPFLIVCSSHRNASGRNGSTSGYRVQSAECRVQSVTWHFTTLLQHMCRGTTTSYYLSMAICWISHLLRSRIFSQL